MRRRYKYALLGMTSLFVLLWLIFSNTIIANFLNREIEIIKEPPLDVDEMGVSFLWIDRCEQTDSMYDTLSLVGSVYNLSEATDDESSRSLLLSSDEICYRIPITETSHWQYELLSDFDPLVKIYTGFSMDISALSFANGYYDIIFQIEENGVPVTRVNSGYVLEKVNGHASLTYSPSEPVEERPVLRGWANAGINTYDTSLSADGTLTLKGWAIIDGVEDASETDVYVEVFSGGKTQDVAICVYAEYDGTFYQCAYHFVPNADFSEVTSVTGTYVDLLTPEQLEQLPQTRAGADAGFSQINMRDNGILNLSGWGIINGVDASQTEIYLELLDGSQSLGVYKTIKESVPNIADYLHDPIYTEAGFTVSIPNMDVSTPEFKVYVAHDGTFYHCAYRFVTNETFSGVYAVEDETLC